MSKKHKKSELQARLDKLEPQVKAARENKSKACTEFSKLDHKKREIQSQIDSFYEEEPTVSDHAIVRYFERVLDMDIEALKKSILTPDLATQMKAFGGKGKFPIGEGVKAVAVDNVIVTIQKKYKQPTQKVKK